MNQIECKHNDDDNLEKFWVDKEHFAIRKIASVVTIDVTFEEAKHFNSAKRIQLFETKYYRKVEFNTPFDIVALRQSFPSSRMEVASHMQVDKLRSSVVTLKLVVILTTIPISSEGTPMADRFGFLVTRFVVLTMCLLLLFFVVPSLRQSSVATGQSQIRKESRAPLSKRFDLGGGLERTELLQFRGDQVGTRVEIYKRNGQVIMKQYITPSVDLNMRIYYRNGKDILTEQIDKNGRIVNLYLTDDNSTPVEMYERQEDGTTVPVSSERLTKAKEIFQHINKNFGPVAEAAFQGDEKQARELLEHARDALEDFDNKSSHDGVDESTK